MTPNMFDFTENFNIYSTEKPLKTYVWFHGKSKFNLLINGFIEVFFAKFSLVNLNGI